jgi:hypothetical protein
MATKNKTLYPFVSVLDQNKLNHINFVDWYRKSEDCIKARKSMRLTHPYLNHMFILLPVPSRVGMRKSAISSMR